MRDVSFIEVNLSDLDHNVRVLKRMIGPACGLCPIVKADAYGLGAARIAKRLAQCGAELLAVYTPDQAAELFRAAVGCRVLVLMPLRELARVDELYRALVSDRLQLTVHDLDHVGELIGIAERFGLTVPVHLEIDTGMSRGGCSVADAPKVLARISGCRRLQLAGVFTHFSSAESDADLTQEQMDVFDRVLRDQGQHIGPNCRVHVASSCATMRHKRYHRSMIRIGLAWAGYGWELMREGDLLQAARSLRPIASWKSRLVQLKTIEPGTPVGYGATWTARRRSIIGLVPVGYADGYPAALHPRKPRSKPANVAVLFEGRAGPTKAFAPVVGAVNMDQMTVDLTDAAERARKAGAVIGVNSQVELIGTDPAAPNHLCALAQLAGAVPHELLCRLNPRIRRSYLTAATGVAESQELTASALAG